MSRADSLSLDDALLILERAGMIENRRSCLNDKTMRPYTFTDMQRELAGYLRYKCNHCRAVSLLLKRLIREYELQLPDRRDNNFLIHAINGRIQDELTRLVSEKTGEDIDLDLLNAHPKGFCRWRSYWSILKRKMRLGKMNLDQAVCIFLQYYKRKIQDPELDGRHGKPYKHPIIQFRAREESSSHERTLRTDILPVTSSMHPDLDSSCV